MKLHHRGGDFYPIAITALEDGWLAQLDSASVKARWPIDRCRTSRYPSDAGHTGVWKSSELIAANSGRSGDVILVDFSIASGVELVPIVALRPSLVPGVIDSEKP